MWAKAMVALAALTVRSASSLAPSRAPSILHFAAQPQYGERSRRDATRGVKRTEQTERTERNANQNQNVLIVDHLNLNHQKGRHDLLSAFYFDLLGLAVDPRKEENVAKGKKTLWANAGIHQFHLPEGKPNAQVFDGVITLAYKDLRKVVARIEGRNPILDETSFAYEVDGTGGSIAVTDPWGTAFNLVEDPMGGALDPRGSQPGPASDALGMPDLCVHVPPGTNLAGISRFYEQILGASTLSLTHSALVLQASPSQTLSFRHKAGASPHADMEVLENGPANNGVHVSMYIADLKSAYAKAEALGVTFVNHRFSRQAYTLEEAVEQCMFRVIDVVDPDDPSKTPILQLEHEVRSTVKADGKNKYKSCPFDEVPALALDPASVYSSPYAPKCVSAAPSSPKASAGASDAVASATAAAEGLAEELNSLAEACNDDPTAENCEVLDLDESGPDMSSPYPVRQRVTEDDGWTQPIHRVSEELGDELNALAERCANDPTKPECELLGMTEAPPDASVDYPVRERIDSEGSWTQAKSTPAKATEAQATQSQPTDAQPKGALKDILMGSKVRWLR
eukprot:CAMPEP_0182559932 /NCGR_PEP_ID=MMETSP1324-20130603/2858_1 /TAXON_ID=236786 /ORGANISM="Florenciella sp., Strain RCC1587" /LENGTH=567 /DNA_ID=CAMNT_0024772249 /DNA_START=44 /DNA_END=1747 /DNA_ORIENTATION=-